MNKTRIITFALAASIMSSSCLGSFSAFNNLKDWNHQVSDSKFVNNLLFWGLNIIPVYGLFLAGDAIIFNLIEFWSGSNPIAMAEGDIETETIVKNGNSYELTATKNKMNIKGVEGDDKGKSIDLVYSPENKSWSAQTEDGKTIKLSSMEEGFYMVYLPNGEQVKMDSSTTQEEGMAIINSKMLELEKDKSYALSK